MASAKATHKYKKEVLDYVINNPKGPIVANLARRAIRVRAQAQRNLSGGPTGPRRIRTGRLKNSIQISLRRWRGRPAFRISTSLYYAKWVHDGTGLYGPRKALIYPKTKKVLRWKTSGGYVYARYTRGMRPNHFLAAALAAGHTSH